jgi:integrase
MVHFPPMRTYGTGSLWLRKSKRHPKGAFWIRYRDSSGQLRNENSKHCLCHDGRAEAKAERLLAQRLGEVRTGMLPSARANRTLVSDLADALLKAHRVALLRKIPEGLPEPTRIWREANAEELLASYKRRWALHLEPLLGDRKAALITEGDLSDYIVKRHEQKAKNATINRELAFLRRAYQLGYDSRPRLVHEIPHFPERLPESARTGFVEDDAFNKVMAAIPEPGLRAMVLVAFRLGFRKAELKNLLVLQVAAGCITLFAGATKNARARKVVMPADVRAEVENCCTNKAPDAHVFTWPSGKPIRDFRVSWAKACDAAKVPELSFHDLRRSAVRRIVRKGIPATVGMRITGHLTRSVFDDYDVTSDQDLHDAADKL